MPIVSASLSSNPFQIARHSSTSELPSQISA